MVSFVQLRRIVFGTSCAVVFGFGGTQALALPTVSIGGAECFYDQEQQCQDYCAQSDPLLPPRRGVCTRFGSSFECECYPDLTVEP